MCNFFSALVTRDGKVVWDGNSSSHEDLIAKAGLKDDKLEDRDFVRVEYTPSKNGLFTLDRKDWAFKVDEKGTLPTWFVNRSEEFEGKVFTDGVLPCLKPLKKGLKRVQNFLEKDLPKVKWFQPDGKPLKEWKVFYGDSLDAARETARETAWNAAWNAAGNAAWNAAWNAALYARFLLVADLKFKDKEKHWKHIKARWQVWQKGYGLYCDVNGVMHVYAKKEVKKK